MNDLIENEQRISIGKSQKIKYKWSVIIFKKMFISLVIRKLTAK